MFPNVPKKQKLSVFNLEPFKRPLNTLDRKRRAYFNKTTPLNEESKMGYENTYLHTKLKASPLPQILISTLCT